MTRIIRLFIAATFGLPAALSAQTPAMTVANGARAASPPASLDSAINRLQDFLTRYPKAAYMTEIEYWRELADGRIEFTIRRLPTAD